MKNMIKEQFITTVFNKFLDCNIWCKIKQAQLSTPIDLSAVEQLYY